MPNWCELEVSLSITIEEAIDCGMLVPHKDNVMYNLHALYPDTFKTENPFDWEEEWDYRWCIENIGCKWFTYFEFNNITDNVMHGQSPWGPPNKLMYQVAKKFPEVVFNLSWEEPGMEIRGDISFDGFSIDEEDYELGDSCSKCGDTTAKSNIQTDDGYQCYKCREDNFNHDEIGSVRQLATLIFERDNIRDLAKIAVNQYVADIVEEYLEEWDALNSLKQFKDICSEFNS